MEDLDPLQALALSHCCWPGKDLCYNCAHHRHKLHVFLHVQEHCASSLCNKTRPTSLQENQLHTQEQFVSNNRQPLSDSPEDLLMFLLYFSDAFAYTASYFSLIISNFLSMLFIPTLPSITISNPETRMISHQVPA